MSVSIQDFGKSTSGQTVKLATLKNDFIEVQLLSYAAIIHRIIVKTARAIPWTSCWAMTPPPTMS